MRSFSSGLRTFPLLPSPMITNASGGPPPKPREMVHQHADFLFGSKATRGLLWFHLIDLPFLSKCRPEVSNCDWFLCIGLAGSWVFGCHPYNCLYLCSCWFPGFVLQDLGFACSCARFRKAKYHKWGCCVIFVPSQPSKEPEFYFRSKTLVA